MNNKPRKKPNLKYFGENFAATLNLHVVLEAQGLEDDKSIRSASKLAYALHEGQTRKNSDLPYILHPIAVAVILAQYTNDKDVIIAGLLHDTLEDTTYTEEKLRQEFGDKVANIVKDVTENVALKNKQGEKASWQTRKDQYLNHLKEASPEALMVCAADKIDNLRSVLETYQTQGDEMWRAFNAPPHKQLWFYTEVVKIIKMRLENKIVEELRSSCKEMYKTVLR